MAEVVECLLWRREAPSSNPNPTKKKREMDNIHLSQSQNKE
jgi:hypothetical protein